MHKIKSYVDPNVLLERFWIMLGKVDSRVEAKHHINGCFMNESENSLLFALQLLMRYFI